MSETLPDGRESWGEMGSPKFQDALAATQLTNPPIHWTKQEEGWLPEFTTPLGTIRTAVRENKELFAGEKRVVCMMFASLAGEYLFGESLYDVGSDEGTFLLISRAKFDAQDQGTPPKTEENQKYNEAAPPSVPR